MEYKRLSAEDAVKIIHSGNRVFIHGSAATPVHILEALQKRHTELKNVELVSITTLGNINFNNPLYKDSFFINSLFAMVLKVLKNDISFALPLLTKIIFCV